MAAGIPAGCGRAWDQRIAVVGSCLTAVLGLLKTLKAVEMRDKKETSKIDSDTGTSRCGAL
jgi:hypothetical protein